MNVTAAPPEVCTLGAGVEDAFYTYKNALDDLAAVSKNTDLDGNYSRFPEKALRVAILLASIENHHVIDMRHWGPRAGDRRTLAAKPAQPLPGIQ